MSEIPRELRQEHREQMAVLEDRLLWMGDRIAAMLAETTAMLGSAGAARHPDVARLRDEVLAAAARVDEDVFRTLALQAPVASELRLVHAMIRINLHLARMAELAANIARAAAEVDLITVDAQVAAQLREMGVHSRAMLEGAMGAFRRRDRGAAARLAQLDEPLDQLNRGIFRRLLELGGDERSVDRAMRLVLLARYLERFGDHAVAIGEALALDG